MTRHVHTQTISTRFDVEKKEDYLVSGSPAPVTKRFSPQTTFSLTAQKVDIIAYIANYCRSLLTYYTGFNAQNIPHVEFEVLNSLLKENTLFGTFMLIRLNTSKCPFKSNSLSIVILSREYDNTQLMTQIRVHRCHSSVMTKSFVEIITNMSQEKSKTPCYRLQMHRTVPVAA